MDHRGNQYPRQRSLSRHSSDTGSSRSIIRARPIPRRARSIPRRARSIPRGGRGLSLSESESSSVVTTLSKHSESTASADTTSTVDYTIAPVAEEVIRFTIPNAKRLGELTSPAQLIGNVPWSVTVEKLIEGDHRWLSVYVNCNRGCLSSLWDSKATLVVRLLSGTDPLRDQVRHVTSHYDVSKTHRGYKHFLSWEQFRATENGYIQKKSATIEVRVVLLKLTGYRLLPPIDFLTPRTDKTVTLVIEGTSLYVLVQTLLDSSPVFRRMLLGDFTERNQDEIALPDVQLKEFVELLNVLGTSQKSIDSSNCEYLMALADRFQFDCVMNKCEKYIIMADSIAILSGGCFRDAIQDIVSAPSAPWPMSPSGLSAAKKLHLAEKYTLPALQDHTLRCMGTASDVADVGDSKEFKQYSDATKLAMLSRIFELV